MADDRGTPLTQSGLSQRIGLTTGATSSLLNRLEVAGHIVRLRDSADRRVVTLRATAGVSELVDHYFNPLTARMNEVMDQYAPGTLAAFERFITEIKGVMEAYTTASPGAPAGGR
jgi:DNA-binding MarR family transcriptional regulator